MAPFGKVTYDPATGRYRSQYGGFLSAVDLKMVINEERSHLESRLIKITQKYLDKATDENEWQRQVMQAIKEANLRSMTIAAGGKAAISQIPHNRFYFQQVRADLKNIAKGFSKMAELHKNGDRTDGQLIGWMKYKSSSVFRAFSRAEQLTRLSVQGANQAIRSLDPVSRHCPDCPSYVTDGWVAIEEIVNLGVACRCGGRCRCKVRFRFNPKAVLLGNTTTFADKVMQINQKAQATF